MPSSRATAEILLKAVGNEIGTPLGLDENGECIIARDDGQEVIVVASDNSDRIAIMAPLLSVGPAGREALFEWLLEVNLANELTQGATIGLDRSADMLAIRHAIAADSLDGNRLSDIIANVFALVDELISTIGEKRQTLASASTPAPSTAARPEALIRPSPADFA